MSTRLRFLLVLLGFSAIAWLVWKQTRLRPTRPTATTLDAMAVQLQGLLAREEEMNRTVWAQDDLAQRHGAVFEQLWDSLNAVSNRLEILAQQPVRVILPTFGPADVLPHGLRVFQSSGAGAPGNGDDWVGHLRAADAEGWRLDQIEFRHEQFDPETRAQPARSRFYFNAHLVQTPGDLRAMFEGDLHVTWKSTPRAAPTGPTVAPNPASETRPPAPSIAQIDASQLRRTTRAGSPPFEPWLDEQLSPPAGSYFIDPLILRDLDGDGRSEIIMVSANRVFRLGPDGHFAGAALCRHSPGLVFTAVMADFDRDGATDVLVARFEGLILFRGSPEGTFDQPGRLVWAAQPRLKYGQVLTCGDVDADGDLDVWLGQYKGPYDRGQMPSPWFDANDGHPSWLLLNDGRGGLADATEAAGLAAKRHRRTYSGSLADLDGDGDLDLAVVSDFAGVAFYANDGRGRFNDLTRAWAPVPAAFGMAHALADFDADGHADFLMMGMQCPTPQRLDHLGLHRPGTEGQAAMRRAMVEGNRLFRRRPAGGFEPSPLNPSIARSGWSWGCAAADLDCDGYPDVYIGNGHETRPSVRDYEPEFWRHDIYVGNSTENPVTHAYFQMRYAETRGRGWSYGGWEKNRLFLNRRGAAFTEVGHLLGVTLAADSRNVAADDLDADGRPDLLVTTFEVWPEVRQTLKIFRNRLDAGHWIGVHLREVAGRSPVGAEVVVYHEGGASARPVITGDSHRVQHAPAVHFGLGRRDRVERIEIRWPGGKRTELLNPATDRYHEVIPPE